MGSFIKVKERVFDLNWWDEFYLFLFLDNVKIYIVGINVNFLM